MTRSTQDAAFVAYRAWAGSTTGAFEPFEAGYRAALAASAETSVPGNDAGMREALADTIMRKLDEPSFRSLGDALGSNLTEMGYILAFKVRSTGPSSMVVRLSSGHETIVSERDWTAAALDASAPPTGSAGDDDTGVREGLNRAAQMADEMASQYAHVELPVHAEGARATAAAIRSLAALSPPTGSAGDDEKCPNPERYGRGECCGGHCPASVGDDETGVREALERAAKIADGWLDSYGAREVQHVTAREWACDAVRDIAELIRGQARAALAPQPPKAETPTGVGEDYPEKIDWLRYGAITEMADAAFAVDGTAPSEAQMDRLHTAAEKMLNLRVSASLTLAPQPTKVETPAGVGELTDGLPHAYLNWRRWRDPSLPTPPTTVEAFKAGQNAALSTAPAARAGDGVAVDVQTMETSRGPDFFVRIKCGERSTTPFVFRERFKAAYEADHLAFVFGLRPDEPNIMDYDEASHPNAALTAARAGDGVERVRHLKRGTEYEVLYRGVELHVAVARGEPQELIETTIAPEAVCWDGDRLVIYRGGDGKLEARVESEFDDGRFVTLTAAPAANGDGA